MRALIARLWSDPYAHDLVRWGTELHDKFLLPWWVEHESATWWATFAGRASDFEAEWLEPFLAFRFPLLGETIVDGVRMELRMGVEPWHVLGEESSGTGTARYDVDSSVERLQLRVDDYVEGRHNRALRGPSRADAADRQPRHLRRRHPLPGLAAVVGAAPDDRIHSPLVFDLVDRWSGRSLGGCTYHVVHPRWPRLRHPPRERVRGRGPAPPASRPPATRPAPSRSPR